MKHMKLASLVALSLAIGGGYAFAQTAAPAAPAAAPAAPAAEKKEEMPGPAVEAYAREFLKTIESDPKLVAAIKESTAKNKKLSYEEVQIQDFQWQIARTKGKDDEKSVAAQKKLTGQLKELGAEGDAAANITKGEALIKGARENAVSKWLGEKQDATKGKVTEVFVMDGWGWNVGQTGGTSDFYQGDEGKWQKTFLSGDPKEVEVLPIVEEDGIRYAQVSLPIKDGGKNIGAVTIGVDVDKVK